MYTVQFLYTFTVNVSEPFLYKITFKTAILLLNMTFVSIVYIHFCVIGRAKVKTQTYMYDALVPQNTIGTGTSLYSNI